MKLVSRLLCLLILVCALTGCGTDMEQSIKVQADLQEAQRSAQIGQLPSARQWADRAIAVNPHLLATYVYLPSDGNSDELGIASLGAADNGVFSSINDNADLVTYMKEAAAALPKDYQPLQVLDQAYGMLGNTNDQKQTAATLAALLETKISAPGQLKDEALMLALAQAYCDAGNITKGTADFQNVIQAYPKDPVPYNYLAYEWAVADSTPNLAQALADAKQSLALATKLNLPDEDLSPIEDTLGWVQYRLGDDKDALGNIQSAVSSDPREPEERYHLGMVYLALHQPLAARAELTHAVQLAPGYAAAQAALNSLGPAPAASSS